MNFSAIVGNSCAESLLLEGLTFAVNVLFQLQILHDKIGFVHSDISPSNIMFSEILGIWKLNDYDQAFPIEKSARTPRTAGTQDFIAPESARTGIFTVSSDVFSLGSVLLRTFYFSLMFSLEVECENRIKRFWSVIREMMLQEETSRISVREALSSFFELLSELASKANDFKIYGENSFILMVQNELKSSNSVRQHLDDQNETFNDENPLKNKIKRSS